MIVLDNLYNSNQKAIDRIEQTTQKKVKFYKEDILDKEASKKVFQENKIDAVIHLPV